MNETATQRAYAHEHRVYAHCSACGQFFGQPGFYRGCAGQAFLHQFGFRALELFRGLKEVA